MSDLFQRVQDDLKKAMIAKEADRLEVIRMLKSALKNLEIDNPGKTITDAMRFSVVSKQIKQRQDAAEEFKKAGRAESSEKELKEAKILSEYLPQQMGDAEMETAVQKILKENTLSTKKDFGKAMKMIQDALQGQADNKRVSAYLNKVLQ